MTKLIIITALLVTLGREARAEHEYIDGQFLFNRAECEGVRNPAARTWASYQGPVSTGDVAYVRAVVWNGNACKNDHAAFWFTLPEGATLAISPETPVRCLRGNGTGYVEQVPDSPTSTCLKTPEDGGTTFYFGHSELQPGWFLEIQVPVLYQKRLDGSVWQHALAVTTVSDFGRITPSVHIQVTYRPRFASHTSSSITAFSANVGFSLEHFFESGVVDVAYGTDPANLWQGTPPLPSSTAQQTTSATQTLSNLSAATTYYWRVRITTITGTYLGPVQSFTTSAASFLTPCRRFRC